MTLVNRSILDIIGNTPMLKLSAFDTGPCELFVKLENHNPGGSIKDRIGLSIIEEAEKSGVLKPGGTIIEATAGNTGIGLALVGFVFVFLPHHPADISAHDNKYQASTVRQGWEWLLTPLMVFQNYHLIHHLYPNVPFYNYLKIWNLKRDELTPKRPAIQTAFGLRPVNR
mgnify:CR=1 FL=1